MNKITVKDVVNGIVCGLHGYFDKDFFHVIEIIYPDVIGLHHDPLTDMKRINT
jgi:hypothetical protein